MHGQRTPCGVTKSVVRRCSLQARCPHAQAFILSGNKDVTKHLRMKAEQRMPITIGGMDCRLIKYTVSSFIPGAPAPTGTKPCMAACWLIAQPGSRLWRPWHQIRGCTSVFSACPMSNRHAWRGLSGVYSD